jgi:prophage tail gpP-like protein
LNEIRPDAAVTPFARPMYLKDDESHSQEEIEAFAKREMSLYTRKSLVCNYTVAGHTSNGHPWTVDTIVDVDDECGNVHEPMWIQERTFTKSRSGGTRTSMVLLRVGALEF